MESEFSGSTGNSKTVFSLLVTIGLGLILFYSTSNAE